MGNWKNSGRWRRNALIHLVGQEILPFSVLRVRTFLTGNGLRQYSVKAESHYPTLGWLNQTFKPSLNTFTEIIPTRCQRSRRIVRNSSHFPEEQTLQCLHKPEQYGQFLPTEGVGGEQCVEVAGFCSAGRYFVMLCSVSPSTIARRPSFFIIHENVARKIRNPPSFTFRSWLPARNCEPPAA